MCQTLCQTCRDMFDIVFDTYMRQILALKCVTFMPRETHESNACKINPTKYSISRYFFIILKDEEQYLERLHQLQF